MHAIEVLRDLDDSGREPVEDDIRALAAYAGWGGAQKAFEEDGADPAWSGINTRLRELLTDAEYADARSSTLTAFYTPRPVADAMWQALGKAGFGRDPKHPDMVLEPGCGTGNFIRSTPDGSSYASPASKPTRSAPASHATCARTTTSSTTGWNGPACPRTRSTSR